MAANPLVTRSEILATLHMRRRSDVKVNSHRSSEPGASGERAGSEGPSDEPGGPIAS